MNLALVWDEARIVSSDQTNAWGNYTTYEIPFTASPPPKKMTTALESALFGLVRNGQFRNAQPSFKGAALTSEGSGTITVETYSSLGD